MRLFFDNIVDQGDLTATSEDAEFPVSYLANELRSKRWKTTGTAALEHVDVYLSGAQSVQALIILDHDFDGTETLVKIQGDTTGDFSPAEFSENVTLTTDPVLHVMASAQTYDYWRFTFTKASAADIRSIGRMFIGPITTLTSGPSYNGWQRKMADLSTRQRSESGQIYSVPRETYRMNTFGFTAISDTQKTSMLSFFDIVGTHTSFFAQINESGSSGEWFEAVYCKCMEEPDFTIMANDGTGLYWDAELKLEEQL